MVEKQNWQTVALYQETGAYAREHNELDAFRASNAANAACAKAIEQVISKNWDGSKLKPGSALPILEQFGVDRTVFILANTLQIKRYDKRFSNDNMAWAQMVQVKPTPGENPSDLQYDWEISSHPVKLEQFINQARAEIEAISMRETPVYYEPIAYAMEHNEMTLYWDSHRCNVACAKDIKEAIADHYDGYRLAKGAVDPVIQKYGQERTFFVLANTIQLMREDGRVSGDNAHWADTISIPHDTPEDERNRRHFRVREHPGLFDVFVKWSRRELEEKSKLPLAEQLKKAQKYTSSPSPSKKAHERAL